MSRSVLGVLGAIVLVTLVGGLYGAEWSREPAARTLGVLDRPDAGPEATVVPSLPEVPTLPEGVRLSRGHGEGATDEERGVDFSAEMRLLSDARRSLRTGEPAVALDLLDQHRERFPSGAFAEEREAYAILALRSLGHTEEAERRLTDFHAEYPGSTLLDRVLGE